MANVLERAAKLLFWSGTPHRSTARALMRIADGMGEDVDPEEIWLYAATPRSYWPHVRDSSPEAFARMDVFLAERGF